MTIAVDLGRKATKQTKQINQAPAVLTPDLGNETTGLPLEDICQDLITDLLVLDIIDIILVV